MLDKITDNILDEVAKLLNRDGQLASRLEQQDEELNNAPCENPRFGDWLDAHELPNLIKLLNSPDEYFFRKFPDKKDFTSEQRKAFAIEVENHIKICKHCCLKVEQDSQWKEEVSAAIATKMDEHGGLCEDCNEKELQWEAELSFNGMGTTAESHVASSKQNHKATMRIADAA